MNLYQCGIPCRLVVATMENSLLTMSGNTTTEERIYDVKVLAKSYTMFKISRYFIS